MAYLSFSSEGCLKTRKKMLTSRHTKTYLIMPQPMLAEQYESGLKKDFPLTLWRNVLCKLRSPIEGNYQFAYRVSTLVLLQPTCINNPTQSTHLLTNILHNTLIYIHTQTHTHTHTHTSIHKPHTHTSNFWVLFFS